MATLTVAAISPTSTGGLALSYTTAATATTGDSFSNNGSTFVSMQNTGTASVAVSVAGANTCDQGFTHNLVVTLATGVTRTIGKLTTGRFGTTVTLTTTSTGPSYSVYR